MLSLAAALETSSEHPLAEAILKGAANKDLSLQKTRDFDAVTGQGVTGHVGGRAVRLGNARLMGGRIRRRHSRRRDGEPSAATRKHGDVFERGR